MNFILQVWLGQVCVGRGLSVKYSFVARRWDFDRVGGGLGGG